MANTKSSGYGLITAVAANGSSTGKTFVVSAAIGTGANAQFLADIYTPDNEGVPHLFSTITLALAQTVVGR